MTIDECTEMLLAASRAENILNDRRYMTDARLWIREQVVYLHTIGGGMLETATIKFLPEKSSDTMGTWRVSMEAPNLTPEEGTERMRIDYTVRDSAGNPAYPRTA